MPGPHLAGVGQGQQPVVQRMEDAVGALARVDREVGQRDAADEERVAGQRRPRLGTALGVDPARTPCARGGGPACAARAPRRAAERELAGRCRRRARARTPPRPRGGCGCSRPSTRPGARDRTRGRRGCGSRARARCARPCSAPSCRYSSMSRRGSTTAATARVVVAHEIAGTAEVVVRDLAEDHGPSSLTRRVPGRAQAPRCSARTSSASKRASAGKAATTTATPAMQARPPEVTEKRGLVEPGDGARLDVAQPRPARHHQREDRRHAPAHRVGRDHLVDRAAAHRADAVGRAGDGEQRARPATASATTPSERDRGAPHDDRPDDDHAPGAARARSSPVVSAATVAPADTAA